MFSRILLVVAVTVVMLGCTGMGSSVERKPGTFTSVTFPVISDLWVDGTVQLATKNKNGCGNFSKNMLPHNEESDLNVDLENVDLEGSQDIFFHISRADAQVECNKFGIFYANKGNEYFLNLETKNKQCEISLTEKTPNGKQARIKTFPVHVSMVDGIKVCQSKDKLY